MTLVKSRDRGFRGCRGSSFRRDVAGNPGSPGYWAGRDGLYGHLATVYCTTAPVPRSLYLLGGEEERGPSEIIVA